MLPSTIQKIFDSTALDQKNLVEFGLKAAEELGELSEAILSYSNVSACGYKNLTQSDVIEEAIDVIIVCMAVMAEADPGLTVEELDRRTKEKIKKWYEKIGLGESR